MDVKLTISYEQLRQLIRQLPATQRRELLVEIADDPETSTPLTPDEKKAIYHAAILTVPVNEAPSIRREDWYGDDGR